LSTIERHPFRVDRGDLRLAAALEDDDVAGREHAEFELGLQRLVGERRVARFEDQVRLASTHSFSRSVARTSILAEHAEPLGPQWSSPTTAPPSSSSSAGIVSARSP
jgi:hypothetical protein